MLNALAKLIGLGLLNILVIIAFAVVTSLFTYYGWNKGVAIAMDYNEIGFGTAFWLSVFFAAVGASFRAQVTQEASDK